MRLGAYSVYDEKAQVYFSPQYFHYKGEAVRVFEDIVWDPKSVLSKHPGDYVLYRLGDFDDQVGKLFPIDVPELVVRGSEVKVLV